MAEGLRIEAPEEMQEILDHVERGEEVTLTRHGAIVGYVKPAAPLQTDSLAEAEKRELRARAIDALLRFRQSHPGGGLSVQEIVEIVRADRDRDG